MNTLKIKYNKFIKVNFLIFLFAFIATPKVYAANVTTFGELSNAIENGETEIVLENDMEFSSSLTITENVKIDGNNKTLSRNSNYLGELFIIPNGSNLELANITIDGGAPNFELDYENPVFSGSYGHLKTINGDNDLVANDSLFKNSGNLVINNSTIQNTRTSKNGSVISGIGDNTIKSTNIKHTGSLGAGGALYITGGTTKIEDSTVDYCVGGVGTTGNVDGGFLYINGASFAANNTTFKNNFAQLNGGVFVVYHSDFEVKNSTFDNNATGNDGAIGWLNNTNYDKKLDIEDSTFTNNRGISLDSGQSMGSFWIQYWYATPEDPAVFKNVVFRGNVLAAGGGISGYGGSDSTFVSVDNMDFYENKVSSGGAFYLQNGNYDIKNLHVHDNTGTNATAIYSTANVTLTDSIIEDNETSGSAAGILVRANKLYIDNTQIINNKANGTYGGGIYVYGYYKGYNPDVKIDNTIITNNSAICGGGIVVSDISTVFSSITLGDNTKLYNNHGSAAADDFAYMRQSNTENTSDNRITLNNIGNVGISGIDGWYRDGSNARFKDTDNPIKFDDYVNNTGNSPFFLKAAGISTGSYDGNGGKTEAKPVTIKYGEKYIVDDDIPVRAGYTFLHWNTKSDDSGIILMAKDEYDGSDGFVLYAIWEKNEQQNTNPNWEKNEQQNTNPNTGDNIMFYILMLVLSMIGLTGIGLYKIINLSKTKNGI